MWKKFKNFKNKTNTLIQQTCTPEVETKYVLIVANIKKSRERIFSTVSSHLTFLYEIHLSIAQWKKV